MGFVVRISTCLIFSRVFALGIVAVVVSGCAPKFNFRSSLTPAQLGASVGPATTLVFTTEPFDPGPVAGVALSTQPVVAVEDAYGNVVTTATSSIQLKPFTDSACTSPGTGTLSNSTLSASSGIASFGGVSYTKSGSFYIRASSGSLTSACSAALNVAAGPPSQLVWTTALNNGAFVNGCVAFQIGVEDQYGNTATVSGSADTVSLSSTGNGEFYSDSVCGTSSSSATITIGQSETPTMYFSDDTPETVTVGAASVPLTAAPNQAVTSKLESETSYSQMSFTAGTCVSFTVTAKDAKGNVMAVPVDSAFSMADTGNSVFYSDSGCTVVTSPYIPSGQSAVTLYTVDDRAETLTPWAYADDTYLAGGAYISVTVNPAAPVALLITGPTFVPPGSCAPDTVFSSDIYGNASPITGSALSVDLSATGSAQFYSDSGCSSGVSGVSIGVSSSSQGFYVKDAATEMSTLTASGTSFISGTFDLDSVSSSPLQQVVAGANFVCVLINGGVECWGNNSNGQLGNGTTTSSFTPVAVSGLGSGVQSIVAGYTGAGTASSACALKTDGTIWCWGDNYYSQIPGGSDPQLTPFEIQISGIPLLATQISMGGVNVCAVTSSGALYCWGSEISSTPSQILGSEVVSAAVGGGVYCAVLTGGDLKCWGSNGDGQVGNGTTTNQSTPVQVTGLTSGISGVAFGYSSTCSVNSSGAVQCWGSNDFGELGEAAFPDGTSVPEAAQAPLTSGVSTIAGGGYNDYYCALTTAGALYCWGSEAYGQLGNGSAATSTPTPQLIFSSGAQSVSATPSGDMTCAIVSGNVECWGDDNVGQLGTAMLNQSDVPVYPGSLE